MSAGDEICRMDATALVRSVSARELSPVEVVDAVLNRLDRLDPAPAHVHHGHPGPGSSRTPNGSRPTWPPAARSARLPACQPA